MPYKNKERQKEYYRKWAQKNKDKVNATQERYRQRNLELCRERGRVSQRKINDRVRFGNNRIKVLERDDYACQICGKNVSGDNMACIHHRDENKSNNKMENLITHCKSCHPSYHYKLHKYQFKKGNTPHNKR